MNSCFQLSESSTGTVLWSRKVYILIWREWKCTVPIENLESYIRNLSSMRKIFPLLVALLVFAWVAYALVPALFPDTPLFPRVPTGSGTIGSALARLIGMTDIENYTGTGVIDNTLMLDGMSATWYMRPTTACISVGTRWIGIDTTWLPICGLTSPAITDFGTIESQDDVATIYHASGSISPSATGMVLRAWDIMKTPPGKTLTIVFSDLSILRLDGDTVVSLDIGYLPSGTTIASALLENGSLWWRILTETGSYNVGTREIIAWVRGTSISLISTGNTLGAPSWTPTGWTIARTPSPYDTEVAIIDTTTSTGAVIACRKADGWLRVIPNLAKQRSYRIAPGWCGGSIPSIISRQKPDIFAASAWVRTNTQKDLSYMYRKLSLSGSALTDPKKALITSEINTTKPEESGTGVTATGAAEWGNLCGAGKLYWNDRYGCQERDVLAIADYSLPIPNSADIPKLDIRRADGSITGVVMLTASGITTLWLWGIDIIGTQRIAYDKNQIIAEIWALGGKKIVVELENPPTFDLINRQIIFLDWTGFLKYQLIAANKKYYYSNAPLDYYTDNDPTISINITSAISWYGFNVDLERKRYIYRIAWTSTPTYFIIGNNFAGNAPINSKIKSIKILN